MGLAPDHRPGVARDRAAARTPSASRARPKTSHELERWYLDAADRPREQVARRATSSITPHRRHRAGAARRRRRAARSSAAARARSRAPRPSATTSRGSQGDVAYWRAALRVRDAAAALADARNKFDERRRAAPAHVDRCRRVGGVPRPPRRRAARRPAAAAPPSRPRPQPRRRTGSGADRDAPLAGPPAAPLGTALPVEPPPDAGSAAPPAALRDAGLPPGGVLM